MRTNATGLTMEIIEPDIMPEKYQSFEVRPQEKSFDITDLDMSMNYFVQLRQKNMKGYSLPTRTSPYFLATGGPPDEPYIPMVKLYNRSAFIVTYEEIITFKE